MWPFHQFDAMNNNTFHLTDVCAERYSSTQEMSDKQVYWNPFYLIKETINPRKTKYFFFSFDPLFDWFHLTFWQSFSSAGLGHIHIMPVWLAFGFRVSKLQCSWILFLLVHLQNCRHFQRLGTESQSFPFCQEPNVTIIFRNLIFHTVPKCSQTWQ